jgi:predicted Zn-dependent protease
LSLCLFLSALAYSPVAVCAQEDTVMKAMRDELARSMGQLHMETMQKPYFIAYRTDDLVETRIAASLGSLTEDHTSRHRLLGVELRVGDYQLDNGNFFSARNFGGGSRMNGFTEAPLDDDYLEIRRRLWLATDAEYKKAAENYSTKKAVLEQRKQNEDAQDFSHEEPAHLSESQSHYHTDMAALEDLARAASAPFTQAPGIYSSGVELEFRETYTRYLNSEGTTFSRSEPALHMIVRAATQAPDGLPLTDVLDFYGRTPADLPKESPLVEQVRQMIARLSKLRDAPYVQRYNGPLLFEDQAAGEVFAEYFAPALVAVRTPIGEDPQFEVFYNQMTSQLVGGSLVEKIGGRVLSEFLSVSENPRLETFQGAPLPGSWKIDDDGVLTHPNQLVEKGMLKTLLTTRTPPPPLEHSTGSRRGWGPAPTTLTVSAEKSGTMTRDALRQELLRRAKARGLEYGLVVRRVGGSGVPGAMRLAMMSNGPGGATTNSLTEVYKLFPDGHEELVRGMELSGMTVFTFRDIVAAGDKPVRFDAIFVPAFNAVLSGGASGAAEMPIASYIVPSLLFEEATMTKATGTRPKPPVTKSPLEDK